MEEGGDPLQLPGPHDRGAAVAELVQERRRSPAEQPFGDEGGGGWQARTEGERRAPGVSRERVQGHVLPTGDDSAARRLPAGQEVDPGSRVRSAVAAGGEAGQRPVQVRRPCGVDRHQ